MESRFKCRENALAITKLEEALLWLGGVDSRRPLACREMIERDVHAGTYGRIGRPNFMSVYHTIHEPAEVLEQYRSDIEKTLEDAARERGGNAH